VLGDVILDGDVGSHTATTTPALLRAGYDDSQIGWMQWASSIYSV